MRNGIKTGVIAVIAVAVVPVAVIKAIMIPSVTNFLQESLSMDRAAAISAVMDYLSLSYAVLLGVVVYRQTERINRLEATQYDMYIGVESIDYSCNLEGAFASNSIAGEGRFVQVLGETKRTFLLSVEEPTEKEARILLIPLSFVTKSQPLVVSIHFEKAHLNIMEKPEQQILWGDYDINETVNTIFTDGSHFILCLGLILPQQRNADEICFELTMELENQIGQKQRVQCNVIMAWAEKKFNILSSYSKRLP